MFSPERGPFHSRRSFGAILGRSVGYGAFSVTNSEPFDVISVTIDGLAGAVLCAWLGLRLAELD